MSNDWSDGWTARIGLRIREERLNQGLSTQDLADRTAELGYPMARASVGNFETRPRSKIYLQDVVILAAALGVPPVELLYPLEPLVIWTAGPGLDDAGAYATLRNVSVPMLPGEVEPAHRAAGWFTGGFGRSIEARVAAMGAVARFVERQRLLAMLEGEDEAGELRERAEAAGAPPPEEFLPVLRMEVYDLAVAADAACRTHDAVAERARDRRAAVPAEDRRSVEEYAAQQPDPFIAEPARRPDVHYVFGIGPQPALRSVGQDQRPHVRLDRERMRPSSYYETDLSGRGTGFA
ncbi:hypothetical protein GCM10009809_38140 [Isoptericola hypogeus]|uniref:HTH cro/C1-type domain-containing protein n=2 Tax=Isoptericola hypogeus TaxID=300179 RepID=A0ABN2JUQ3_9MICO